VQEDAHRSDCAFGFTSYKDWIGKYAMKKLCIKGQWRNKLILIVISRFSLVNAAMNALRVCKLRKNCLTGIDQCAMVLSKSINGRIYGCKLRNEKKFIPSALRIFTAHIYIGSIIVN
jgi:hypothetical protein